MTWQPIETAPKDGTEILAVYVAEYSGGIGHDYSIVRWEKNSWIAQADGQRAIEAQGDTYTDYIKPFVNYWQPLPPAPETR